MNLTKPDIQELVRSYFRKALSLSVEHAELFPQDTQYDQEAEVEFLEGRVRDLKTKLATRSFSSVETEAKRLLRDHKAEELPPASEAFQQLCQGLLRADLENDRILAAMLAGNYGETAPRDPWFEGIGMVPPPPLHDHATLTQSSETLKTVAEKFHVFKAKHDWAPKTEADVSRVLKLARTIIGADKPITQLSVEHVKAVRDAIGTLPPNYSKIGKNDGLNLQEVIAGNSTGPTLSLKTQDKYFTMFRQFLIWACQEGYIDKVPGDGVKIAGASKVNAADRRRPYTGDQLASIFSSPLFTGQLSSDVRHKPGKTIARDGKFWIPLVALYSGMRMGEIVQLLSADIKSEGGITYFDVSKSEGQDKKIKTLSSIRQVPVHKALFELGFGAFVQKADANSRLFPEIDKGADGYYSHNFSKWWGRYSRKMGWQTPSTTFHSFRHNFKDALQAAEVQEYVARALMGHSKNDVHANYGSGPSLSALKSAVDKIVYPEVNLSKSNG